MRAVVLVPALLLGLAAVAGADTACRPTAPDALGPFYEPNAPERSVTGHGLVLAGVVRSATSCTPLAGATLEWWSTDPSGRYDAAHRATQRADDTGRYHYETSFPGIYPGRPAHLHVRVSAPGHRVLVTQVYPRRGHNTLAQDFVLVAE